GGAAEVGYFPVAEAYEILGGLVAAVDIVHADRIDAESRLVPGQEDKGRAGFDGHTQLSEGEVPAKEDCPVVPAHRRFFHRRPFPPGVGVRDVEEERIPSLVGDLIDAFD